MDKKLSSDTWESLMRVYAIMMRQFQCDGNWDQISMQEYDVLYTLAKAGCSMSQKDLLGSILLSQPALSRLQERLACRGLVERFADPDDKRVMHTRLTEAGRDLQREVGRQHSATIAAHIGKALTEEEMHTLQRLAHIIEKANSND